MRVNSSMSPGLGNAAENTTAPRDKVTPPGPPSPPPAGLDQLPQGGTGGWPRTVRGRCCSLSSADPCGAGGAPLRRLSQLRVNAGPLDAFRRHSWEPGKEEQYCPHYEHHSLSAMWDPHFSVSLERLDPEGMDRVMGGPFPRGAGRDPRRNPIIHSSEMLDSLTSLTEESEDFLFLQDHADRLQAYSCSAPSLCVTMSDMERPDQDPDEISLYSEGGGSTLSVNAESDTGSVLDLSLDCASGDSKAGSPLNRTLSFFKKMAGKSKNKEKERMKEREKEAREREARYTNGHLFTSITVSGTTLCSACNKSITAKEALSCPTCNVTIHNRCRDTLPNCTKMKQKQQKLALVRNSSAIQNVALRNKSPMNVRERPSSAIYPSDSLRQSLLGSRRVRSGLLSKSVSTNNIAGNLNEDAPLGLRRILSQSTDSLNFRNRAMSIESLNDEGEQFYSQMLSELEAEGEDFEADSWSLAVDTNFLQQQRKDVIKRQDVIYELIQTELHHVRTLRIMAEVFRRGMLEELQVEPALVHAVFPCLDELTDIHVNFLSQLLRRRKESLAEGSQRNFIITQLGDILLSQFSGCSADRMRKAYVEFCSRHNKSVKQYKELLARDKRFQQFIRRASRGALLRRHGVQECILLVTQRVTKYPVLIDRILHNTKGNEEEAAALKEALVLIRELLSSVDQEVHDLERTQRLQEIHARLDPRAETNVQGNRAETTVPGSGAFRSGEIMRRRLMHEGPLLWKIGSRFKDVQVLLMTDILVFLQEKDQKYTFPILDKPPVVSLKNLIVRDIANQERGMFLICDSTPPVMYEIHSASREDRNTWMKLIKQTVSSCPRREEFPLIETEDEALLRKLRGAIQQKDRELVELLQERVSLFSEVLEVQAGEGVSLCINTRNLFRAETPEAPRGEKLIMEAIREVERLGELLVGTGVELTVTGDQNHSLHRGEPEGQASLAPNGEEVSVNGTHVFCRTDSNPGHRDRNGNRMQENSSSEEVFQRLVNLNVKLHALQAAVLQQDSLLELCQRGCSLPGGVAGGERGRDKLSRSLSRDGGLDAALGGGTELVLLQRQHSLIQEELSRTRGSEARLRDSERARAENERQLRELREHSAALQAKLDILQGKEADKRPRHSRQNSLPNEGELRQGSAGQAARRGSEGDTAMGAPLPLGKGVDQTDQSQRVHGDCSDPEANSEDEEEADELSTGSSSPREFQRMHDIPEESECGAEQREAGTD